MNKWLVAIAFAIGLSMVAAPASAASPCIAQPVSQLATGVSSALGGIASAATGIVALNASAQAGVAGSTGADLPMPGAGSTTWTASAGLAHTLTLVQQVEQLTQAACQAQNGMMEVTQLNGSAFSSFGSAFQGVMSNGLLNNDPNGFSGAAASQVYAQVFGDGGMQNDQAVLAELQGMTTSTDGTTAAVQLNTMYSQVMANQLQEQQALQAAQILGGAAATQHAGAMLNAEFDMNEDTEVGLVILSMPAFVDRASEVALGVAVAAAIGMAFAAMIWFAIVTSADAVVSVVALARVRSVRVRNARGRNGR